MNDYEIKLPGPDPIAFQNGGIGGENRLFTIRPDGTIERGPAFTTTDEMSLKFWELLIEAYPVIKAQILAGAPTEMSSTKEDL